MVADVAVEIATLSKGRLKRSKGLNRYVKELVVLPAGYKPDRENPGVRVIVELADRGRRHGRGISAAALLVVQVKRLVVGLLVPHHLAKVPPIDLLAADRACVKMVVAVRLRLVGPAGLGWSKVRNSRHLAKSPGAPFSMLNSCVLLASSSTTRNQRP